ncbi:hypothetical protein BGZ93_000557 [Podila epicladia]|nr:hypothetical protein BGZ93_000557 [Podila epicladia]
MEALDISTVLDVLFGFAYRYLDLKLMILHFVANVIPDLYEMNEDPFASYIGHPQRHELLSETINLMFKVKAKAETDTYSIQDRLEFDILLSSCVSTTHTLKNPSAERKLSRLEHVAASFMYDIDTTNMAFTFGYNGSARNVALWTHQSVLQLHPTFNTLIGKIKDIEDESTRPEAVTGYKTIHVTKYTLESYCALIRYLYCNSIDLHINLDDFPIGQPPTCPFSPSCKNRLMVDGPLWPTVPTATRPHSDTGIHGHDHHHLKTTWEELFQLADFYQIAELRAHCQERIIDALDSSTVLDVLFRYAYRYPDLKERVLAFASKIMAELYARSKDPFAAYAEHPERHELMAEALHLMFEAKAQISHSILAQRHVLAKVVKRLKDVEGDTTDSETLGPVKMVRQYKRAPASLVKPTDSRYTHPFIDRQLLVLLE